jgi:subtilisin family serine protease
MIASIAASLLAAISFGTGPGIDCKVANALTQPFVPNRVILRATQPLADDPAALQKVLSDKLHVPPSALKITPVGATAFAVDSIGVDIAQPALFDRLQNDDHWRYAVRDPYIFDHGDVDTDDTYFHSNVTPMWGLRAIHAPATWASSTGSADVVVAIVDGGISPDHEDLTPLWKSTVAVGNCPAGFGGYDAIDNRCQIKVRSAHATEMAGTIGAHAGNHVGVVGVNWTVSLLSSAFMDKGIGCASAAVDALHFVTSAIAAGVNVRVVNLSWGTSVDEPTLRSELQVLSSLGVVLVASAGNDGNDISIQANATYPATYPLDTLIAVAAAQQDLSLISTSNRGATVHIAAPGLTIVTTSVSSALPHRTDTYDIDTTGTSIAAAHVTGTIALLAAKCPKLTGKQLKDLMLDNSQPVQALNGVVANKRFLDAKAAMDATIEKCKAFE